MRTSLVDVRAKLALFFLVTLVAIIFNSPLFLASLLIFVLLTGAICAVNLKKMVMLISPLLPIFILLGLFTSFFSLTEFTSPVNQETLFCLGDEVCVTRGGALLGISMLCRIIVMIFSTSILLQTTPLDEFVHFFNTIGLPPTFSFVITTAIRFVPEIDRKKDQVINAQRARGVDLETGQWIRGLKARISIMIPLIISGINLAENLSIALLNRGFGYSNHWTIMKELRLKGTDYFLIFVCLLLLIVAIYMRSNGFCCLL